MFYLLFAAITERIDKWVWIGPGLILPEVIVLLVFKMMCPLTIIAPIKNNNNVKLLLKIPHRSDNTTQSLETRSDNNSHKLR